MKTKFKKSVPSKNIIKSLVLTLFLSLSFFSYSQVTTTIKDFYSSGISGYILDCYSPIDITNSNSINLDFDVELIRSNQNANNSSGLLKIYYKTHYNNTTELFLTQQSILSGNWSNYSSAQEYRTTVKNISVTLHASDFNFTDGVFYAVYEPTGSSSKYSSCEYDVVKNPIFNINHASLSIPCASTSPVVFTVTNVHSHSGSISYQWQVGSSWFYNGGIAPTTITTTSNTITLTPRTYPPGNVTVTTTLNGTLLLPSISSVHLSSYNPIVSISGVSQVCSTAVLSVNSLPAGSTVTSWTSSNTSVATISSINGHQGLITSVNDGTVNISAIVENSCGQQKTIWKTITVGSPNTLDDVEGFFMIEGDDNITVETKDGIYDLEWKVNGVAVNDGGADWVRIYFSDYPCVGGVVVLSVRRDGVCGWSDWLDMTYTDCGEMYYRFNSNPIKEEIKEIKIKILENTSSSSTTIKNQHLFTINIFDINGKLVYKKSQKETEFNLKKLSKGLYIVKYKTLKGKIIAKKLLID